MGGCTSKATPDNAAAPAPKSETRDKVVEVAEDGDQVEGKAKQAAVAATGVIAAGAIVTAAIQNVDYLEKMQSLMEKFEGIAALADSPAAAICTDLFNASEDILKLVAHAVIPPPGGQILAAALTITGLVIKGAMNVQACKELAIRCNRLVQAAFPHQEDINKMGHDSVKGALQQLLDVCKQVEEFIQEVLEQSWWKKMLNVTETSKQIKDLDKEMESVRGALLTATALAGYTTNLQTHFEVNKMSSILQGMDEAAARANEIIAKHGGYEEMSKNKEYMQELIEATGGVQSVMLNMHQESLDMLRKVESYMKAQQADKEEGPHQIIHNESLKTMWKTKFTGKEHVDWNDFWCVFPSNTPNLHADDIQILTKELEDYKDKTKLRLACDANSDDKISATELQAAFPTTTVSLVDQVRALKARPAKKGDHDDIPPLPLHIFGRDKEVNDMFEAIRPEGPCRVATIVGGPGEGKLTIAGEVARKLYDKEMALGGIWRCKMADVTSGPEMLSKFIDGITVVSKPDDKENGGASTFKMRLTDLARRGVDMYVLIDDIECVAGSEPTKVEKDAKESKPWKVLFEELVIQMLKEVPKMKLILISRDPISQDIKNTAKEVHELKLKSLDLEAGEVMIQQSCPSVTAAQAKVIAENYDRNPLMLSIVSSALKSNRMTVEQAMTAPSLRDMISDKDMDNDLKRVENSIVRSLDTLAPGQRTLLLKMALLLPGTFTLDMLKKLLDVTVAKAKVALTEFKKCTLLEEFKKDEFRITSMLREAANKIYLAEGRAEGYGIGRSEMEGCWKTYVTKCCELVQQDFKKYKTQPCSRYMVIKQNKPFVQHALRLVLSDPDMAKVCLQPLLDILGLLPYLGLVHDSTLVQEVCQALYSVVEEDEDMEEDQKTYLGLCKAVQSHFAPAANNDDMKVALALAEEAVDLLEDASGAKMHLALAMALRRKGAILRDMWSFDLSVKALQSAKYSIESGGLGNDVTEQAQLELILDLTELAGTLDYKGDIAQGEPIAEEALQRSRAFHGEENPHPVTALCLTTFGYFLKGKGEARDKDAQAAEAKAAAATSEGKTEEACLATEEAEKLKAESRQRHEAAVKVHKEALGMRQEVLGKEHLEVALSYQQAAISLVPLGKFEEAEKFLKLSLDIRQMNLKEFHLLIFNTYREYATLYRVWAKPELQAQALRDQVRIGCECFGVQHKKVVPAAQSLVAVLKAQGLEEEAQQVQAKHGF